MLKVNKSEYNKNGITYSQKKKKRKKKEKETELNELGKLYQRKH